MISAMALQPISVRCVSGSLTGVILSAFLVLDVNTDNSVESNNPEVLTCLGVFEPHLFFLIFRLGWGPHSLQTSWSPVLAVCRGCDLCLRGEKDTDRNISGNSRIQQQSDFVMLPYFHTKLNLDEITVWCCDFVH